MDLQKLAADIGIDEKTLKSILMRFLETTPADIVKLEKGISSREVESVQAGAHHIKGAALNLDLLHLSDLALRLEEAAKKDDWPSILQLFAELQSAYRKEEVQISKLLI